MFHAIHRLRSAQCAAFLSVAFAAACADATRTPLEPPTQASGALLADSAGDYYYYQGEKLYLDVDPTRLVIVGSADEAAAALSALGVTSTRREHLPAPEHWLLYLSPSTTTQQAILARAALKADPTQRFVSNVYRLRN